MVKKIICAIFVFFLLSSISYGNETKEGLNIFVIFQDGEFWFHDNYQEIKAVVPDEETLIDLATKGCPVIMHKDYIDYKIEQDHSRGSIIKMFEISYNCGYNPTYKQWFIYDHEKNVFYYYE